MNIAGNSLEHVERDKEIKRNDIRWCQGEEERLCVLKGVYCLFTFTKKGGSSMQTLSDDRIFTLITHPISEPAETKVILPYPSFIHSNILCG